MFINGIIPAPHSKRAVWFDPSKDELVFATADVIGLIELQNPDHPEETAVVPMYMSCDHFGVYSLPQLDINFLEFANPADIADMGKYTKQIEDIKALYKKIKDEGTDEVVEVETKGNVSKIKRIIKNVKTENPKHED